MKINSLLINDVERRNDYVYNLDFALTDISLEQFRGIKHVCMQGSPIRAKEFAKKLAEVFLNTDSRFFEPVNLFKNSLYQVYRVGSILSISHGMGNASVMTLLHSITKIMYYADNLDVSYIRIGTSGGIDVPAGDVVVTETAYMPDLVAGYKISVLGKDTIYPTRMNHALNQSIVAAQPDNLEFMVRVGNSIAADDFYLGQARFDGAIKPKYDEQMRAEYFAKIKALNILNFEMESTALASFCERAEIPATMIAVTLLNRMQDDQVRATPEMLEEYSARAQRVAINYLKANCG